jgi:hypothetical protein
MADDELPCRAGPCQMVIQTGLRDAGGASMLGGSGASLHLRAFQPTSGSATSCRSTSGKNITMVSARAAPEDR